MENLFVPTVEIIRSFSYKLNTGNYQSCDFFASQKSPCLASEADAVSEALYQFCKREVMRAVAEYAREMRGELPPEPPARGDNSDAAFQAQARRNSEKEQSPFVVHDRPKETPAPETKSPEPETTRPAVEATQPEQPALGPPAATKRRGRPPATAKPDPAPEPPAERGTLPMSGPQLVPDKPKDGYQATEDDVPAIIGPTKTLLERRDDLLINFASDIKKTKEDAGKCVVAFIRKFLAMEALPLLKDKPDVYAEVIPILEAIVARGYAGKLAANPAAMGEEARQGWNELLGGIGGWRKDNQGLAVEVALMHYPDHPSDLLGFVETAGQISEDDLQAFLLVAKVKRDLAAQLRDAAKPGRTMFDIIAEVPVLDEPGIAAVISGKIQVG